MISFIQLELTQLLLHFRGERLLSDKNIELEIKNRAFLMTRRPRKCLEYLVVHEMIHILEPSHNARFRTLLDKHLPSWQNRKKTLNSLPVRHEKWGY
jgi:predicted metal-dependent hydrolase